MRTTFLTLDQNSDFNNPGSKPGDTGFDRAPWLPEDELMHQLVNCHYVPGHIERRLEEIEVLRFRVMSFLLA